jgi:ABC-type nitrate/sulfonate/bicarbonate transport system substrate-binding protein
MSNKTVTFDCFFDGETTVTTKLQYGVPTDRSGLNIRFGIEKGFFSAEGIDLSVRVVFGGPEISAAYDTGDLKIGELGSPPGITAIGNGKRFKIVGSGLQRGAGLLFVVRPEIRDWSDLRGKVLGALSIGSCSYWYLKELLSQHGVDPDKDVTIRGLGKDYSRQLELFEKGEIVGLLTAEPNAALGEARGLVKHWGDVLSLGDVPPLQWVIQVANDDFLAREPDLIRRVLRGAQRASRYLGAHRDEWISFTAKHYAIPQEVAAKAIERELPFVHLDGQLDFAGLRNAIALQHQLGAIPSLLPPEHFVAFGFQPDARSVAA